MSNRQRRSHANRILRRLLLTAAIIVLVIGGAIIVINAVLLPPVAERLGRSLENTCDCSAVIGSLRYWPFYGIVAGGVTATRDFTKETTSATSISSVGLRAARIRVPFPVPLAIRWLRYGDIGTALFLTVQQMAAAGLLPERVTVAGLELEAKVAQRPSMTARARRIELSHDAEGSAIFVSALDSSDGTISGNLEANYRSNTASGHLRLDPVDLTIQPFAGGTAAFELAFRYEVSLPVAVSGSITMRNLRLDIPAVAEETIGDLDVDYNFEATYTRNEVSHLFTGQVPLANKTTAVIRTDDELSFSAGNLRVNDISFEVKPVVYGLLGGPAEHSPAVFRLIVRLPVTDIQSIIDNVPKAISGKLAGTGTTGTISWNLDLSVPMDDISRMQWTSDLELDNFAVVEIDPSADVFKLNGEFVHTIHDGPGFRYVIRIPPAREASMAWMLEHSEHTRSQIERMREEDRVIAASRPAVRASTAAAPGRQSGPEHLDRGHRYVYVDDMSPWIIRAVLTAEDGDFFFYGGINPVTLADAVALNFESRDIVLGASTISMQVVKLLFLDQKRIFARKIQEAFLVYLMEHQVPVSKERILELYLNLAELGPGIYGISDASRRYFAKEPAQLTAGEATWLASILPSPKTYYREFEDGRVSADSLRRMVALYDIMLERGRMSPEEYREAVATPPEFARRR